MLCNALQTKVYQEDYAFLSCVSLSGTQIRIVEQVFWELRRLLRQQQLDKNLHCKGTWVT
ncbi:MAG: hypothetical protein ACFFC7_09625 [Candidatus Hermodarchaeota archaeon]